MTTTPDGLEVAVVPMRHEQPKAIARIQLTVCGVGVI
jgi:hypothetical protein